MVRRVSRLPTRITFVSRWRSSQTVRRTKSDSASPTLRGQVQLKIRTRTASSPKPAQYWYARRSVATLETPYGCKGSKGALSEIGAFSGSTAPYSADDPATTTRTFPPSRRTVSKTLAVPITLVSNVSIGRCHDTVG